MRITSILCTAVPIFAGCFGGSPDESEVAAAVVVTPSIALGDSFLPFQRGLFQYAYDRGRTFQPRAYPSFGVATTLVHPNLDVGAHDDAPDHKARVRITLINTNPVGNPNGDIIVRGTLYERDWPDPLGGVASTMPVTAPALHFAGAGTQITETYFDKVTDIETTGLGLNVRMEVELWDGHEQEMDVGVGLDGITDEATCVTAYHVYFNGQLALPEWDPIAGRCSAGLKAEGPKRGLYFGLASDRDEEDAFHHFINPTEDPTVESGHISPGHTWEQWIASLGTIATFFLGDNGIPDTLVRPIVVELERRSDQQVIDAARMMLTVSEDPWGNPVLVSQVANVDNPGAIAQVSPRGLDRLETTHASTLPYPIVPAGTQPRLSQSAIAQSPHLSDEVTVDLVDLPEEDLAYWTEENKAPAPNEGEFAGFLAYQDIVAEAEALKGLFDGLLDGCKALPNPAPCELALRQQFCVENAVKKNDFRIRVLGVDTFYEPTRTEDALVIGDITGMDLWFGTDEVLSDYTLEDIQGWLRATIDPSRIQIEWDKPRTDLCTVKPAARLLSDYTDDSVDRAEWLTCRDLSFASGSGSLADPLTFDIAIAGEAFTTPLASGTPTVQLAEVTAGVGTGICEQEWLAETIEEAVLDWQAATETTIGVELATSPGQDEALDRLLSPYELGIERVTAPPAGTPPYDVHPLGPYDLAATIGASGGDLFGAYANATDGMYMPYLTRSTPVAAVPFAAWFCPMSGGQDCDGLAGEHPQMLTGGRDPANAQYDVALTYTTAHLNQALWAQARRPDHLGSPNFPARLTLTNTAVVDLAGALGFTDVVDALTPLGTRFGVRYYQQAAPYTSITDEVIPRLIYVVPNIVVELVSINGAGAETVVAKFLVDVLDRDLQVAFSQGGTPLLDASWGARQVLSMTSTYVPGCYGARTVNANCNMRLLVVIGALWWPHVDGMLLDMIEQTPALQRFDSATESLDPRNLKNVRTFLANQSVTLVGDLCEPGTANCP